MSNSGNAGTGRKNSNINLMNVLLSVIVLLLIVIVLIFVFNPKSVTTPPQTGSATKDTHTTYVIVDTVVKSSPSTTQNQAPPQDGRYLPGRYPEVSTREITYDEIRGKHVWDVLVMRNEVYARYGYIFQQSRELRDYFNAQPWYSPRYTDVSGMLTPLEKQNVEFLRRHTPAFDMNDIRGSNTYVR